ncbi:MAG TPA: asparagine synthase (glutamine-hydrolyzing) [Pyrinomonadaceae bacterium]|nr:asparagine synthase (glutamine-hydrolyzing) [Pyrinomonadaceae bacterium]
MCGIAGALNLSAAEIPNLGRRLGVMNQLLRHRGPDGEGAWWHERGFVGLAHRRLSIIDLSTGDQPMKDPAGNWITYNGEVYNYIELREELGAEDFQTTSDTEVVLAAYRRWGKDCVTHLRGMFAFALWDEARQELFCARDRFGIKPFYYATTGDSYYFASEVKALLPFVDKIETDVEGFKDYLAFQFCLAGKTLFKGIKELLPGHTLSVRNGAIEIRRYWEVYYELDFDHTSKYFDERLRELLPESVNLHLRADVPVGTYLSGGLDSSAVASIASRQSNGDFKAFTGKFSFSEDYDESRYARALAEWRGFSLHEIDITATDFIDNIRKVIYHLDYPVAGPGSFPQYMVSQLAAKHRKVVLGGQGGDEIFGGYTRYLIAYFEQCIKAAIDGTINDGNYIVTYESIIPNLTALHNYKPMLQEFWREGLFEDMDRRYFRLINRAPLLSDEIHWNLLGDYSPFETFQTIFNGKNVRKESYFDRMTHFDFKTLLPALLQVEDRVSMAHGLESRVPFLDHPLVEFAATMPSNVKFKDGTMKQVLKDAVRTELPDVIIDRKDKMGFPTPLTEWINGEARDFVQDTLTTRNALSRDFVDNQKLISGLDKEPKFGRKVWGLLCLELWQQEFHDQASEFKRLLD